MITYEKMNVIIFADNENHFQLYKEILISKFKFNVVFCNTFENFLDAIQRKKIDLIFFDYPSTGSV